MGGYANITREDTETAILQVKSYYFDWLPVLIPLSEY
jgi:hypothetical protein